MNRLNPNEWNRNGKWNWNSRTWQLVRYLCISSVTFISCIVRDRRAHVVWRETHGKFSFLKKLPIHVRAQQLATKKYCSSNANFIELFSVPFSYPNRWFGSVHWQHSVLCVCVCVLCSRVFKYVHQPFTCGYYCMLADRSCLFVCFRLISKAIIIELWEQRAQNIYSIRCKHNSPANMCSIPFKWTFFLNRKLFIFTFSFLSL